MTTKIPAELSSTPGIVDNSDATAITIASDEKVGIGETSPQFQMLTVKSSSATGNNLRLVTGSELAVLSVDDAGDLQINAHGVDERIKFLNGIGSGTVLAAFDSDGLKFGSDTAAANALDDYEEGIHTVTMTDSGGGATITLNTSFNQISYTKIGRLVHVSGVLLPSAVSGSFSGTTNISLPFAAANLSDQAGKGFINVETYSVDFTSGTAPAGHVGEGTAAASILVSADNAAYGFARVSTSSQIYVGGTYITDA